MDGEDALGMSVLHTDFDELDNIDIDFLGAETRGSRAMLGSDHGMQIERERAESITKGLEGKMSDSIDDEDDDLRLRLPSDAAPLLSSSLSDDRNASMSSTDA